MQPASATPPAPMLDRKRLAAVLELIGSDKPGERQAAAEAAHRLIRAAGVRWHEVLVDQPTQPEPPEPPPRNPTWRDLAAACRDHRERLTGWEAEFVASISRQRHLSRKQFAILARIAGRVRS